MLLDAAVRVSLHREEALVDVELVDQLVQKVDITAGVDLLPLGPANNQRAT